MREDWIEVELGEIFDFIGGGTPSKKESSYWDGNIPWASIKDIKGDYLLQTQDYITEEGLSNSSASLVFPNEIILATRINPGRPIISKIKTAINQDLKIVRPKISIDIKFIYYCFLNIERKMLEVSSGTTVMGITLNSLKEVIIPLAPLPEQRAIAAKIEQLFSELDNGIANLKTAKSKLEIYRQAILKQAFEGTNNQDIQFRNGTIGEFSSIIAGNAFKKSEYSSSGIRLFQIANVSFNRIIWDSVVYLPSDYLQDPKLQHLILNDGDLVMALNRPMLDNQLKIGILNKFEALLGLRGLMYNEAQR